MSLDDQGARGTTAEPGGVPAVRPARARLRDRARTLAGALEAFAPGIGGELAGFLARARAAGVSGELALHDTAKAALATVWYGPTLRRLLELGDERAQLAHLRFILARGAYVRLDAARQARHKLEQLAPDRLERARLRAHWHVRAALDAFGHDPLALPAAVRRVRASATT